MALFTTILPEHSLAASSLTRVKVLGLKKCQPESRVQFSVFWRKRNYFASKKKEKKKAEKKARHQPRSCICLVNVLSILQILLARDWFISPLAGPAAVVQTSWPGPCRPGWAPQSGGLGDMGPWQMSSWPRGHGVEALPLTLLQKGPSSLEEQTRQVGEVGWGWQRSPVRLLWAGAAPGLGLPVTNSYNCSNFPLQLIF